MGTNYKPFRTLKEMINQPSGKHWMMRNQLTEKHGFAGPKKKGVAHHKALTNAEKALKLHQIMAKNEHNPGGVEERFNRLAKLRK